MVPRDALALFVPGVTSVRYLAGDRKQRDLPVALAALDLCSIVPATANSLRIVNAIGRATHLFDFSKINALSRISAATGRAEVLIGTFRFVPLAVLGMQWFWSRFVTQDPQQTKQRQEALLSGLVLFGAGILRQTLAARTVCRELAKGAALHPGYVDFHVDAASGLFGIPFPSCHPPEALLPQPFPLDFTEGATGSAQLGKSEIFTALKYLRLLKWNLFGDTNAALKGCKAQVGRLVYWLSRSRVTATGLEHIDQIPKGAVLVVIGSHQSTMRDYVAPWLLGRTNSNGFNRLAGASMVADVYNYYMDPVVRFSSLGRLFRKTLQLGFIRRKPQEKGLRLAWRLFWEYEYHFQHPIGAIRAGIHKGLGKYVNAGGRICAETAERMSGEDLAAVYYPHGTRTRQFFDNEGAILGGRVLSGITHQGRDSDSLYSFVKFGMVRDLRRIQEEAGEGKPIYLLGFHREGAITPKQFSNPFQLHFGEWSQLGQSTAINIARPYHLNLAVEDNLVVAQIERTMIESSQIRQRLIDAVPQVYSGADVAAVQETLTVALETNDHRPFTVLERILAIPPQGDGLSQRVTLLERFRVVTSATIDELALEVNRALGKG